MKGTKNKFLYLGYYIKGLDWSRMRKFVSFAANESGRSSVSLWLDAIQSVFKYNIGLIDYFLFKFYLKGVQERRKWAGTGYMYEYHLAMNPLNTRNILADKILFYQYYETFVQHLNCTVSDLIAGNEISNQVLNNPSGKIVLKDSLGQCGWDIEVVDVVRFSKDELLAYMSKKGFNLVEAFIQQHHLLQELSDSGLNTLRVITQINKLGNVEFLGARLRITINTQVDNLASGNMAAPVDMATGLVTGPGVFSDITRKPLEIHPMSRTPIVGLQIPFWKEVLDLTRNAAMLHPENRSIGWDVAITENGPSLIEGNHNWCKLLWQLPVEEGLKEQLIVYSK